MPANVKQLNQRNRKIPKQKIAENTLLRNINQHNSTIKHLKRTLSLKNLFTKAITSVNIMFYRIAKLFNGKRKRLSCFLTLNSK